MSASVAQNPSGAFVDEIVVREFVGIISAHAIELAKDAVRPGVLQLCVLSPVDERFVPHRFRIDDVDGMVAAAIAAANAGLNVYIEGRTVRADLRGKERGKLEDTEIPFALVIDSDNDKDKGGVITLRPSVTTETSPGNYHFWYLLDRVTTIAQAARVGDLMRAGSGADGDTGVPTQCYRVPGTPNYPSKAKQARGRLTAEPTRIVEHSGRLWDPDELEIAYASPASRASSATSAPHRGAGGSGGGVNNATHADESTLPDELVRDIRDGGSSRGLGAKADKSRSGLFHAVIGELKKRHWPVDQIYALLEKYPQGVAAKYPKQLRREIERSYEKVEMRRKRNGRASN
jgi:hypothetical protein